MTILGLDDQDLNSVMTEVEKFYCQMSWKKFIWTFGNGLFKLNEQTWLRINE